MVIKVYISSVTCNNQQRKNQFMILSKLQAEKVDFVKIDITDPKHNDDKIHMREHSKARTEGGFPMPPQVFNDADYCGDYDAFENALETMNLWEFLKMEYIDPDEEPEAETSKADIVKEDDNKELQDQFKQKIEDDDTLQGFNNEGEEKKDEEGGEKTKEAIEAEEKKEGVEEGGEEEKKEEEAVEAALEEKKEEPVEAEKKEEETKEAEGEEKKEEDTKEAEAEEEKKEEVSADTEQPEIQVEETQVPQNAEPSKIVEFVSAEPSKISEALTGDALIEVEECIVKEESSNTLRSARKMVLDEESLNQKYAGPMEPEVEKKEAVSKASFEEELLEEVNEEILQAVPITKKKAENVVKENTFQEKETEGENNNQEIDTNKVIIDNHESQYDNELLEEAREVVDDTQDVENEGLLDREDLTGRAEPQKDTEELIEVSELLEDKELCGDDTNDNVEHFEGEDEGGIESEEKEEDTRENLELFEDEGRVESEEKEEDTRENVELFDEEEIKEGVETEDRELPEELDDNSGKEEDIEMVDPATNEEKDFAEISENLRESSIYESDQEKEAADDEDEMENTGQAEYSDDEQQEQIVKSEDDDSYEEQIESTQQAEYSDDEAQEDFEQEQNNKSEDDSSEEQMGKDAVGSDNESLEKEDEILNRSRSDEELFVVSQEETMNIDDIENNEEPIPTDSDEEDQKELGQMEHSESVGQETNKLSNEGNLSKATEAEAESEPVTEVDEKVDKAEALEEVEEEKKPEETETQEE